MKRILQHSLVLTLCLAFFTAHAQFGGGGASGPDFSGAMSKLFGENTAFSSDVEVEAQGGPTGDMNMPAKISYLDGKSRFELNLSEMKGANLPPQAMEQMKQMGMDKLTTISIPDEKLVFMIYPSLKAYAAMPGPNSSGAKGKALFHPIRLALTGEAEGIELDIAVPAIERGALLEHSGLRRIAGARERAASFAQALRADR